MEFVVHAKRIHCKRALVHYVSTFGNQQGHCIPLESVCRDWGGRRTGDGLIVGLKHRNLQSWGELLMGSIKKKRRKKIAQHKRRKHLKADRHKNK